MEPRGRSLCDALTSPPTALASAVASADVSPEVVAEDEAQMRSGVDAGPQLHEHSRARLHAGEQVDPGVVDEVVEVEPGAVVLAGEALVVEIEPDAPAEERAPASAPRRE